MRLQSSDIPKGLPNGDMTHAERKRRLRILQLASRKSGLKGVSPELQLSHDRLIKKGFLEPSRANRQTIVLTSAGQEYLDMLENHLRDLQAYNEKAARKAIERMAA